MNSKQRHFGQSLVEFALLAPLLLFLIFGFLDLGRAVFYYSSLSNAVREGTRYAVVNKSDINAAKSNPTNNSLQDKVLEYAFGLTSTSDPLTKADILVTFPDAKTVSIEATYRFQPVTPGIAQLIGDPSGIELVAQSTMRIAGSSQSQ